MTKQELIKVLEDLEGELLDAKHKARQSGDEKNAIKYHDAWLGLMKVYHYIEKYK